MIKEALQWLVDLGNTRIEYDNERMFSTQPMHLVKDVTAATITVNSLSGLVEYLTSEFDGQHPLMIHVASPTEVVAYTKFNRDMARNTFIQAKAMLPQFRFGSFLDAEEFNIALQAMFVANEDKATMLQVVGNIKDENVSTFGDDGVSQQVTAKTGIATVGAVKVPNPVYLRPYRTFIEVSQPESAFVFRMKSGPTCALFEADGGAWKNEAMNSVRDYLAESLKERVTARQIVLIA